MEKTKQYDLFIFRDDNREKIDLCHVKRLVESIKARNLLELRPIIVNSKMEIIDGQHRVLAAKQLNVDIYYQIQKTIEASDIIQLNINKSWTMGDFLNFYCQHQYPEYIKLREFMKKHNLTLKVALNIAMGQTVKGFKEFKDGKFEYNEQALDGELEACWQTIDYVRKMNGYCAYTTSARFWKAMLKLFRHPDFVAEKWDNNMRKMTDCFTPKATTEAYMTMFQHIYNYRNNHKIKLNDEVYD